MAAARSALEMAEIVAADPQWPGLAPPAPAPDVDRYFEDTASASPAMRADAVAQLIGACAPDCRAAGAYETIAVELGLANSEGQFCWAPSTLASPQRSSPGPTAAAGSPRSSRVRPARSTPARSVAQPTRRRSGPPLRGCSTPGRTPWCSSPPPRRRSWASSHGWVSPGAPTSRDAPASTARKAGRSPRRRCRSGTTAPTPHARGAVRLRRHAEAAGRSGRRRRLPRRRVRPAHRQGSRPPVDRPRPALAEPRGTLPAAPVHGHRRRDGRGDGPLHGARTS